MGVGNVGRPAAVVALCVCLSMLPSLGLAEQCANGALGANTPTTTALWESISSGNIASLEAILADDPDAVHARAQDCRGPLFWAYEYDQQGAVDVLIENGANVDVVDEDGKRPNELKGPSMTAKAVERKTQEEAYLRDEDARIQRQREMDQIRDEDEDDVEDADDEDWEDEDWGNDALHDEL